MVVTECLSVSHCSSTAPGSCERREGGRRDEKKREKTHRKQRKPSTGIHVQYSCSWSPSTPSLTPHPPPSTSSSLLHPPPLHTLPHSTYLPPAVSFQCCRKSLEHHHQTTEDLQRVRVRDVHKKGCDVVPDTIRASFSSLPGSSLLGSSLPSSSF